MILVTAGNTSSPAPDEQPRLPTLFASTGRRGPQLCRRRYDGKFWGIISPGKSGRRQAYLSKKSATGSVLGGLREAA
jgi:hypothetical protein